MIPTPRQRLESFAHTVRRVRRDTNPLRSACLDRIASYVDEVLSFADASDTVLSDAFEAANDGTGRVASGEYTWTPPKRAAIDRVVTEPDATPIVPVDLDSMTVKQLRAFAAERNISLGRARKHAAILRVVRKALDA